MKYRYSGFVFFIVAVFITIVAFNSVDSLKLSAVHDHTKKVAEEKDEALSRSCGGVERWDIKVIDDTAAYRLVLTPKLTSVVHLITLPVPTPYSTMPRYNPVEDSVYTIVCTITTKIAESDSDYHLVLSDGSNTLIGEVPDPNCSSVAASPYINDFIVARKWVDSVIGKGTYYSLDFRNVVVTGQAFLDPYHGQDGAAPNDLELHSILKINFYDPSGVNAISVSDGLRIYPNPSNGIFYVNIPASDGNEMIVIFTGTGERIFESSISSNLLKINLSDRKAGIYIYKIVKLNRDFVFAGKLMLNN